MGLPVIAADEFAQLRRQSGLSRAEAALLLGSDERSILLSETNDQDAARMSAAAVQLLQRFAMIAGAGNAPAAHLGRPEETKGPAPAPRKQSAGGRYQSEGVVKSHGKTYTPAELAGFVAQLMVAHTPSLPDAFTLLDPAIGDGELVLALLRALDPCASRRVHVTGFDTDAEALALARRRILAEFSTVEVETRHEDFVSFVADARGEAGSLFATELPKYDLVIANPPYVRTQVMGADRTARLAARFGLTGRTDLYHIFLIAIGCVIAAHATVGLIVSNRFMTTRAGAKVRSSLSKMLNLHQVWDLGDTKLFDAAVLPAVLIGSRKDGLGGVHTRFGTIYETSEPANREVETTLAALDHAGVAQVTDGRRFLVRHGFLNRSGSSEGVWSLSTSGGDAWLAAVESQTRRRLGDVGKVRVGVKTCADKVFIKHDWPENETTPELLRPLITHHSARRFRASDRQGSWSILYPHEIVDGQRKAIELARFPNSLAYLESHRQRLETRGYVIEAGRRWYEIWVPQDPAAWDRPKLVFRDIAERPTFWIDEGGQVVNGDCYWLTLNPGLDGDLLWLAVGVANSTFIEAYYDHRFNNKLYAGRRRFMTQYVEQFPLPDENAPDGQRIIALSKALYEAGAETPELEEQLDRAVWSAFGLGFKEVPW